ncbi:MAG: EAL domain-containing protein, partial [Rhodospirillales bacterium]|nr:EAL domain-containing protein [Rhodospirillales bacterium]
LSKPLHVDEKEIFTSCTIGICIYPDNALDRVEIMQHADTAMHHGKATDIGGFVFYEEHLSAQVYRNLDIDRNLRRAIERKEFKLLYQPKIDLQSRKIIGCEALIRWESAELGFVPPDEFIIVAERSGLIIDIGNWVLDEACRQGKEWMDKGLPAVHVAVNLSAVQFLQGDIDELITGAVAKHGFDPERLDLELTETMLVVNPEQTINTLKRMKERGMSVSMDDFGTGYSSLSFMAKLPLDNLKVDRSFVMHLPEDRDAATLVRTIVTMAQQLGLAVIAEGIETASQEAFLSALGCEMGQGYLFGKPMEPSDFEDLVRNGL